MSVTLDEKCSCGAEFHWTSTYAQYANEAASMWRIGHRHIEPIEPGICGQGSGSLFSAYEQTCTLRAGHAGWHSDGQGCNWGTERYETGVGR